MNPTSFELWLALYEIEITHWYDVNHNNGKNVHELYVDDGLFAVGPQEKRSKAVIREFYEARAKRGMRTARHLVSNFRVQSNDGDGRARATGVVSLFAGDQAPPLESKPAVLVADLSNEYVLNGDGAWRYVSHILKPIFVGDDPFVRHALTPSL